MNAKTLDDACMWLATFIGPWNLPPLQDGESEDFPKPFSSILFAVAE